MNQSTISSQYVVQPPQFPDFVFKSHSMPFSELVGWAKREYVERLNYLASKGYHKQHLFHTKNYSPKRILAEMSGFRRFCALVSWRTWNELSRAERRFISDAFEMRDLLMKESV
jgi:hypothetical protein